MLENSIIEIIKLAFVIGGPLGVLCFHLYKKLENRVSNVEQRANDLEKVIIEIKTEFKFISRDIREIKELLTELKKT